ncbi:MAG: MBL fold metallo-hydrolase [Gammaproteobacteria bacterium]|nr:MBL fold metallo-hydrolase [Gammaproteobacteria bacterium]
MKARGGRVFRNNYPSGWVRSSFWRWQRERWEQGLVFQRVAAVPDSSVAPDLGFILANRSEPALTWLGHSSFLVQCGGLNVLTDPMLSARASPFAFLGPRRFLPPAIALADLPRIDAVLVSHDHYDHLDAASVRGLARQAGGPPRYLVPLGLAAWFRRRGMTTVEEFDWWHGTTLDGVRFTLTPVQHWSARGLRDRNHSLWGGWRIDAPGTSVFFAGDTGYSRDFADIRDRLGPVDYALLPIGAYEPRWFMRVMHLDPDDAVQVHRDLEARTSFAMHWGTFKLTDEPLDEPPRRLARALAAAGVPADRFRLVKCGATERLR